MKTKLKLYGKVKLWVREGTGELSSDENAAREVLIEKCYRRVRPVRFDVEPGEKWLDLGANIGAFAAYVGACGGTAVCYEPEAGCFRLLEKNVPKNCMIYNYAVTAQIDPTIRFMKSKNPQNNYRGTEFTVNGYIEHDYVRNIYAGDLKTQQFDGIKMDIEGSEGPLIDHWLLPRCQKLVMEYHTSRDSSVESLRRRLNILRGHFKNVLYPKLFDQVIENPEKVQWPPRFDQLIFCWGEK